MKTSNRALHCLLLGGAGLFYSCGKGGSSATPLPTPAQFSSPVGAWADSQGNIFVADWLSQMIRKIVVE